MSIATVWVVILKASALQLSLHVLLTQYSKCCIYCYRIKLYAIVLRVRYVLDIPVHMLRVQAFVQVQLPGSA